MPTALYGAGRRGVRHRDGARLYPVHQPGQGAVGGEPGKDVPVDLWLLLRSSESGNRRGSGSVDAPMTTTPFLPAMTTTGPLRISRDRADGHPAYGALLARAADTGCCPVWMTDPGALRPPDDPSAAVAAVGRIDPHGFLTGRWGANCPFCGCRDPFGDTFPGLAPPGDRDGDPLQTAAEVQGRLRVGHLAIVPVTRPADIVAAIAWSGPCNYGTDVAALSAVLRSWEDRFGALVVRVDRATLYLSVAAPPRTYEHAVHVAAEHFAFCPDVDQEDPRPLRTYAAGLVDKPVWRFWWD